MLKNNSNLSIISEEFVHGIFDNGGSRQMTFCEDMNRENNANRVNDDFFTFKNYS